MSEDTRFLSTRGPNDTMHRNYHGGGLVDFVLTLVDGWVEAKQHGSPGHSADHAPRPARLWPRRPARIQR
jgi:hypothetical protein